jgi:putative transposase
MLKNPGLSGSIADDAAFYEKCRQLDYKSSRYGSKLMIADRFYPSSQRCSNCGSRQKMPAVCRTFECQNCGVKIDRDLNARGNLEKSLSLGRLNLWTGGKADSPGRSKKSTSISGYVRVCVSFIEQLADLFLRVEEIGLIFDRLGLGGGIVSTLFGDRFH